VQAHSSAVLKASCLAPACGGAEQRSLSDNAEVPLVYKRNRHDGVSGAPFRTTTIVKYLNTRRVLNRLCLSFYGF
jgi:hypothetical protein